MPSILGQKGSIISRTILVVDRDRELLSAVQNSFLNSPHRFIFAEEMNEAKIIFSKENIDLLVSEVEFPNLPPSTLCILTADEETFGRLAVNVSHDVYDHVPKPFEIKQLTLTIQRALETKRLEDENQRLREALAQFDPSESIQRTLSACQLLKLTLETTFNLLKPEAAVLFLRDAITGRYEIRDFCARDVKELSKVIGTPNLPALETAVQNKNFILAEGDQADLFFRAKPSFGKIQTFFSVPTKSQGHLFGFINVYQFSKQSHWTSGHHRLIAGLANRVASALSGSSPFDSVRETFKHTIKSLAKALDKKDSYTAGHSDRTQLFSSMMTDGLNLSDNDKELVHDAAQLHDIGKLSIDLSSLNNPGKLTLLEIESFRSHPQYGKDLLEPIFFLSDLIPLVYHHHESFDGSGYPHGLSGNQIPLGSRIISIADSYDAMTSHRAYRRSFAHEKAVKELRKNAGTQFDPELVKIFIEQIEKRLEEKSIQKLLPYLED